MKSTLDQIRARLTKDHIVRNIIEEKWQFFWMNQTQNSEEDRKNYWRRAFSVDANMRHHLADLIAKEVGAEFDRLIRALEYARERAHHYAQLCENGGLNVHAEKANEITDAEITAILEGK